MRRSEINALVDAATSCFQAHGWALPPEPRWDVTDFGLGDWNGHGLVLVNLSEQAEYCEKLMYARHGMTTPCHCHRRKKEDIICRWGALRVTLWASHPDTTQARRLSVPVSGKPRELASGESLDLEAGMRVTVVPGVYHEFVPLTAEAIIGEVSTFNDDAHDNFFVDPRVGRHPSIVEDEPARVRLLWEGAHTS
jgi:D-lyxose ketol-isomerase